MIKETFYQGEKPNLDYTFYEKREQNQARNHSLKLGNFKNKNKLKKSKNKVITDHD